MDFAFTDMYSRSSISSAKIIIRPGRNYSIPCSATLETGSNELTS